MVNLPHPLILSSSPCAQEMGPLISSLLLKAVKPEPAPAKQESPTSVSSPSPLLLELQELDLDLVNLEEANSRPIGETTKVPRPHV